MQKAATERFTRINEQIGELRSMMIQRDKDSQMLEAKALQAIDMVKTAQPDKFMIDMRKQDGKIEALRANIESNEAMLQNALNELKEMRNRMNLFKGIEQVVKLNEDVKAELMTIKKINATVERHADKVETIFSELQKRWGEFERVNTTIKDLDKVSKQVSGDMDSVKVKLTDLASKKELENLTTKVDTYEKHASTVVSLMNKKFDNLQKDFQLDYGRKMDRAEALLKGFDRMVQKTPDLNKYFDLLTAEGKKGKKDEPVEKIKQPGEEEEEPKEEGKKEEKKEEKK